MENNKEKTINLIQRWGAGKIPIGSEFKMVDGNRTITLVECDGYTHGKFVFDDGEEFDVGKYFDAFFIGTEKEQESTIYDENFWDTLDDELNPKKNNGEDKNESAIRKTFADVQSNESFYNFAYFNVTSIIEAIFRSDGRKIDTSLLKKVYDYLKHNNFPLLTKEKLVILFSGCDFEPFASDKALKVKYKDEVIGYLLTENNKWVYAPKNKQFSDEYSFDTNNSNGFFCTAESYLDVALTTIDKYRNEFITMYHSNSEKNKESFGYQADSTIKTLLAFSCECYLKALLIDKGIKDGQDLDKILNEIKKLGHGLSILYASLDDDLIALIFGIMEMNGYNIGKKLYQQTYETNDLTEKFMIDLANVDDAFVDSRYSAENDKNTDYNFLYEFARALRVCAKNELKISSPFADAIESKINL